MASELFIQQTIGGGYVVGTANETGLSAGKEAFFYSFPSRYGAVDVFGYQFRVDGVATVNAAVGNSPPAAVISVFAQSESDFLNGYFVAPAYEIYGTTIGLAGQTELETPVRVGHTDVINVGFPDVVASAEVGGWSLFSTFIFKSVANRT
jgi:hypothetical protein